MRRAHGRWPIGIRAAISTATPVIVGCVAGDVAAGLIATLGAFTSRYGGGRPYLNRAFQLAVIAVSLAAAVALGVWAAQVPWLGVLTVSAIGVAAVLLCNALAVGPPGAYIFVVACAAGIGVSAAHLTPWRIGLLVLAGGAVAWVVHMAGALIDFRRPEKAAVSAAGEAVAAFIEAAGTRDEGVARHDAATALHQSWNVLVNFQPLNPRPSSVLHRLRGANHAVHVLFADAMRAAANHRSMPDTAAQTARRLAALRISPDAVATRDIDRIPLGRPRTISVLRQAISPGSHTLHVMLRVAIGVPVAGATASMLGLGHAYWAMAAAVLVLHQGADWIRTLQRGIERMLGTWVGLGLAAGILVLHPQGLWLAVVLALLNFAIEMLVVRNYALAAVFITATALTISSGSRQVDVGDLLLDRGVDTLIGCVVGLGVYLVMARHQEATRLADAVPTASTPSLRRLRILRLRTPCRCPPEPRVVICKSPPSPCRRPTTPP
ncbi:FUSC family protein [Mycobacterium sp. URHB0021]